MSVHDPIPTVVVLDPDGSRRIINRADLQEHHKLADAPTQGEPEPPAKRAYHRKAKD
jgi:hypothetical protein